MQTIYKLTTTELNQAVADYITKKYGLTDVRRADMSLNIQGKEQASPVLVTATVTWKD